MSATPSLSTEDPFATGRDALRRGDWEGARSSFEAVLDVSEEPEALNAFAMAAWWLDDAIATIDARERAYRLYRERDEPRAAARMATWLAWDYVAFRGEPAVANGWLQRAHRLLADLEPCPEQGWLAIRKGELTLVLENDAAATRRLARRARELGRALGVVDLEMSGLALEGLALPSDGKIAEGMRRLDEAATAVVAGEVSELWAVSRACCYLITACERVRDFDRAVQWSERMQEFAKRWRIPSLFAVCRAHYAAVLMWRGTWDEAEFELETARKELATTRPGMGMEAVVRLGELRSCQGRLEEAAALFREIEFHPLAQLGLAAVALGEGDAAAAADRIFEFLRHLGPENRLQRAAGLELLVRAELARGNREQARAALAELKDLAGELGILPLRASASVAEGLVATAERDFERARVFLEDAVSLYQQSGAPFEVGRARTELAGALKALGRLETAADQARAALESLRAIGAAREADRAAALIAELEAKTPAQSTHGLTNRELAVLRLVADGLSNPEIAERLVLSEHTVHRHLANILRKLDLSSRTAAAAYAARHGLV